MTWKKQGIKYKNVSSCVGVLSNLNACFLEALKEAQYPPFDPGSSSAEIRPNEANELWVLRGNIPIDIPPI